MSPEFYIATRLESVTQDIFYALRGFRKHPVFTFIVVLTLAIGIGATTAVFSVVDPLLFRSLPYAHGDRLVSFGLLGPIDPNEFMLGGAYTKWHGLFTPFESVTTVSSAYTAPLGLRRSVYVRCVPVEANLLATLGVSVAAGHDFTQADDRPNAPLVALLSYNVWQSTFGGRTSVLQHTILVDDTPTRVVGILPKNFEMPMLEPVDVLLPQRLDLVQQLHAPTGRFMRAFARLKPGVSIGQAHEELRPFLERVSETVPPQLKKEIGLAVRGLRDRRFHDLRLASWMLLAAALSLLLLACANVANLLLARAVARQTELSVRAALGAGRFRLIRQGFTESVLLAGCGGIAGSALAWVLFRLLGTLPPEGILRLREASLDERMLLITLLTCFLSAVLFGIAPALPTQATPVAQSRLGSAPQTVLRNALITIQIAFSILLLTGASLLGRSLWKLEKQSFGFEPSQTVAASFQLNRHRYNTPEKRDAFFSQLETRLRSIAGPGMFAISDTVPPGGEVHERPFSNMAVLGKPPLPSEGGMVKFRYITPDYFRVLQIPVMFGRAFLDRDRLPSEHSLVLNAKLARRFFGAGNPLGEQILLNEDRQAYTVVGVVADTKNDGLANAPMPEYYRLRKPHNDFDVGSAGVALFRSSRSAMALEPWVRSQMAALDPDLTIQIGTMNERIQAENRRPKFLAVLIGLFAAFGLILSAVGLYGVVSFLVGQRTREIGLRVAIGASPGAIATLVLKYAVVRAAFGVLAGLIAYFALARTARSLLFEVSPLDPASLSTAIVVLFAAALLAAWRPSHRAARIDPAVALRYE